MNRTNEGIQAAGGGDSLQDKYEMGIVMIYNFCSIVTQPVEYALRPNHGTRYFNPIVTALTLAMMIAMPIVAALFTGVTTLLSFGLAPRQAHGLISVGNLTMIYLAGSVFHTWRLWRRMLHPETEFYGEFEGEPLFFFKLLPKGDRYWVIRIVWEPLFLITTSAILSRFWILDGFAANYLSLAGVMLFIKERIAWYKSWLATRITMDAEARAKILAKYLRGEASDDDLAIIHVARPPKGTPADIVAQDNARLASGLPADLQRMVTPARSESGPMAEEPIFVSRNPEAGFLRIDAAWLKLTLLFTMVGLGLYFMSQIALRNRSIPSGSPKPSAFGRNTTAPARVSPDPVLVPRPEIPLLPDPAQETPSEPLAVPADALPADSPAGSTGYIAKGFSTRLLPRVGPALTDISGPWTVTVRQPRLSIIYRFDIKQNGDSLGGQSLKLVTTGTGTSFAFFPLSGIVRNGGTMFTLDEGPPSQRVPAQTAWCPMKSMTLVPTPAGTLAGRWSSDACHASGTILMVRG